MKLMQSFSLNLFFIYANLAALSLTFKNLQKKNWFGMHQVCEAKSFIGTDTKLSSLE